MSSETKLFASPKQKRADSSSSSSGAINLETEKNYYKLVQQTLQDPSFSKDVPELLEDYLQPTSADNNSTNTQAVTAARNKFVRKHSHLIKVFAGNSSHDPAEIKTCLFGIQTDNNASNSSPSDSTDNLPPYLAQCLEATHNASKLGFQDYQQPFNYYHFQMAISLQNREDQDAWIRGQVHLQRSTIEEDDDDEEHLKRMLPPNKTLTKEFSSHYGPVDKSTELVKEYLRCYRESRKESILETKRKLDFLQNVSQKFGKDVALKAMKYEASKRDKLISSTHLKDHLPEKQKLYNMNPFVSVSHSDWFLLPRYAPQITDFFIRHEDLEKTLVEYKPSPKELIIPGYWPSLIDLQLISDNYLISKELAPDLGSLLSQKLEEIALCPLGVHYLKFFESVAETERWKLDHLKQIYKSVPLSNKNNPTDTLLFPSYLADLVPSNPKHHLTRICKRMKVLAKLHGYGGGTLRVSEVEELYRVNFKCSVSHTRFGFPSLQKMFEYCSETATFFHIGSISFISVE